MGIGGAGDDDSVDPLVSQCRVARTDRRTMAVGKALRRRRIDVDDNSEPRRRMARDVRGMDRTDPPGTELAKIDHRWSPTRQALGARTSARVRADPYYRFSISSPIPS